MNRNKPPPNGETRAYSHPRWLGSCRSDFNQKSKRRVLDTNPGRYRIFQRSAPLVAVRYALSKEQWIWLRWLDSAEGNWA